MSAICATVVAVVDGRGALGVQLVLCSGAAALEQSGCVVVFVVVAVVGVEPVAGRACSKCATRPTRPPWSCSGGGGLRRQLSERYRLCLPLCCSP